TVVEAKKGGQAPPDGVADVTFAIKGDKIYHIKGDRKDEGTLKLDPSKSPKHLDLTIKDKSMPGIYQMKGDTLTICIGETERPTKLKSREGSKTMLLVWKLQK